MAKVFDISIPPSLASRYWQVIHVEVDSTDWWKKAGIAPNARNPIPVDRRSKLMKSAEVMAEWITNKYFGAKKSRDWRDYRWLRRGEIMGGVFDPAHWHEMLPYKQTVGMGSPNCSVYAGGVNPLFDDPQRQPSFCVDYNVSAEYDISLAGSNLPTPYPGWSGSVVGGRFIDEYVALSRISFQTPLSALTADERPSVVVLDLDFEVAAEREGNVYWAGVEVDIARRYPPGNYSMVGKKIIVHAKDRFKETMSVPPVNLPFVWNFSRKMIVPISWIDPDAVWTNARYWDLYVSSMPSLGVFFSLNQYVTVKLNVDAKFYVAKI